MARRYSVFNPEGEDIVTDSERMGAATSAGAASRAAAAELAARLAQQQGAGQPVMAAPESAPGQDFRDFSNWKNRLVTQREQQERLMQTGGDISRQEIAARDVGQNYRTDRATQAGIMGAEDQRSAFNEGKGVRDFKSQMQMDLLKNLSTGGQVSPDQFDQMALMGSILNGQPVPDFSGRSQQRELGAMQLQQLKRQQAQQQIQEALDAGDQGAAEALAAASGVPLPRPSLGDPDQMLQQLGQAATQFGQQDAATFGWDPTQQDVGRIDRQANMAVEALMRSRRLSREQAQQIVNQAIEQALAGPGRSLGTGWIDTLRQQRGIQ